MTGMVYPTASAWDDAVKKDQEKVKDLEEKYNTKILEKGVRPLLNVTDNNIKEYIVNIE